MRAVPPVRKTKSSALDLCHFDPSPVDPSGPETQGVPQGFRGHHLGPTIAFLLIMQLIITKIRAVLVRGSYDFWRMAERELREEAPPRDFF